MIARILAYVVEAFVVLLVVRALLSWFPVRPGSVLVPINRSLAMVTEPILRPVRRILPTVRLGGMGIDLSIVIVILVAEIIVIPLLLRY